MIALIVIGLALIVIGIIFKIIYYSAQEGDMSSWAQNLSTQKYNPNQNRFVARKEANASRARGENLAAIQNEVEGIARVLQAETMAKMAEYAKQDALFNYNLQKQKQILEAQLHEAMTHNQIAANNIASRYGLSPQAFEQLIIEKAKMATILALEERKMQLEIEKDQGFKDNEFNLEKSIAGLDVEMSNIAHLLPEHKDSVISEKLKQLHGELEKIKELPKGEYRKREKKRVREQIRKLEQKLYE